MMQPLAALAALGLAALAAPTGVEDAPKVKVLLIDGQNNHAWQQTTPHMKKVLESSGRFVVDVYTSPPASPRPPKDPTPEEKAKFEADRAVARKAWELFKPEFAKFDVVLSNYNGEPWPEPVQKSLENLLSAGKIGLVIVHAANNSFPGWGEYNKMIGMGWRDNKFGDRLILNDQGKEVRVPKGSGPGAGHGPQHAFKVAVRDREHPVTKGMPPEWMHATDELYQGMRGPIENVHLLATAYADKAQKGTGEHEPMIWTVSYGKGRVFHTPMGHALEAMRCYGFVATLQRGTEWAATGTVTLPLPKEFPAPDKVSALPAK